METPHPTTDQATQQHVISRKAEMKPAQALLVAILGNSETRGGVSDMVFMPRTAGPCKFESRGQTLDAIGWNELTDAGGLLIPEWESMQALLTTGNALTTVFRLETHQLRIHRMSGPAKADRLFVRIQPARPPTIYETFRRQPETVKSLREANGLIAICGPQGGGKTTLAAGLCLSWAELNRHILTLEDPTEYFLTTSKGLVTQRDVSTDAGAGGVTIADAIKEGGRCKIKGLYIGESRDPNTFGEALQFCGSREVVVTTIHADSIAACVFRMFTLAVAVLPADVAKMTLSQRLHTILYVALAYHKDTGRPVPVYLAMPGGRLTKAIEEFSASRIHTVVNDAIKAKNTDGITIGLHEAWEEALNRGASPESIREALGGWRP